MCSDDGDDVKHGGASQAKPTRDARGRWLKGHCPNPKGRPPKKVDPSYDPSDVWYFARTAIEVRANGQIELMDRRTALLNKMFEDAMKGKVTNQRFLYNEFERNHERLTLARQKYQQLMAEWVIDNPDCDGLDGKGIPIEVQFEIAGLEALLNHYFPGQYPRRSWTAPDDDDTD